MPDLQSKNGRAHLKTTFEELIRMKCIPIINTNDAVPPADILNDEVQGVSWYYSITMHIIIIINNFKAWDIEWCKTVPIDGFYI